MRLGFLPSLIAVFVSIACVSAASAQQPATILNRDVVQPDVWRPSSVSEPGVDAKGDMNLQVPVMTVPGVGGLDFPITFSYASSIRLDERASWIGTGWRFDPGSITRDVFWGEEVGADGRRNYTDFTKTPTFQPDRFVVSMPGGGATMSRVVLPPPAKPGQPSLPTGLPKVRPNPESSTSLAGNANGFYTTDSRMWSIVPVISTKGVSFQTPSDGGAPLQTGVLLQAPESPSVLPFSPEADYSSFTITTEDGTRYEYEHPTLASSVFSNGSGGARRETLRRRVAPRPHPRSHVPQRERPLGEDSLRGRRHTAQ